MKKGLKLFVAVLSINLFYTCSVKQNDSIDPLPSWNDQSIHFPPGMKGNQNNPLLILSMMSLMKIVQTTSNPKTGLQLSIMTEHCGLNSLIIFSFSLLSTE